MSNDNDTKWVKRANLRDRAFIVQCVGFRCMAYRDKTGKWRDYFNDDEITCEVSVISEA